MAKGDRYADVGAAVRNRTYLDDNYIDPGEMRHAARLYRFFPDGTVDQNNHPNGIWNPVDTVLCKIEGLSGATAEEARELVHLASHQIRCNFGPRFDLKDELRDGYRTYEIGHINDIRQEHRQVILTCVETQSDQ